MCTFPQILIYIKNNYSKNLQFTKSGKAEEGSNENVYPCNKYIK